MCYQRAVFLVLLMCLAATPLSSAADPLEGNAAETVRDHQVANTTAARTLGRADRFERIASEFEALGLEQEAKHFRNRANFERERTEALRLSIARAVEATKTMQRLLEQYQEGLDEAPNNLVSLLEIAAKLEHKQRSLQKSVRDVQEKSRGDSRPSFDSRLPPSPMGILDIEKALR